MVVLFLIAITLPIVVHAGPLRLSPYRLLLLASVLPCVVLWLRGSAGKIRVADIALLLMCLWTILSYAVIHGPARAFEGGGIFGLETMGAYLFGRILIRSADDFRKFVAVLFWIVVALLPLAVLEATSGHAIILETFRKVFASYQILNQDPRWGLRRVVGPFEHPILFGVFCSSIVGMVYYVTGYGRSFLRRFVQVALVSATAFLSLSSGPLTSMAAQLALISWDLVLRRVKLRWKILAALLFSAVVVIEIVANRSAAQILIAFVAFNPSTAYNRLRIWQFGSASVWDHPWLGVGLNDWERPTWMLPSIDMFWLVPAVRNGLPVGLFLQLAFFSALVPIIFKKGLDDRSSSYRTGYIVSMLGLYLSGWTVHYWNSVYILLMFLLGAGSWLLDFKPEIPRLAGDPEEKPGRQLPGRRQAGGGRSEDPRLRRRRVPL